MSKQGMSFVMANDEEVPNEGEVHLPTYSDELVRTEQRWQVADIGKPLLSVDEEVDKDQWVVLTRRGGFIHDPAQGATRYIQRGAEGGFTMEMSVPPPAALAAGFQRP